MTIHSSDSLTLPQALCTSSADLLLISLQLSSALMAVGEGDETGESREVAVGVLVDGVSPNPTLQRETRSSTMLCVFELGGG